MFKLWSTSVTVLLQVSDLIQVLLRPVPERRPSAEQLLTCSKLDNEVSTSVVDPGSGSRRTKMTRKSDKNSSFEVLDVLF
jgi:hypothetical protein